MGNHGASNQIAKNNMQMLQNLSQNYSKITLKILPKCSQMAPWTPLRTTSPKCYPNLTFLDAIWEPFWRPRGSLGPPEFTKNAKSMQKSLPKIGT